MIIDFHSHAFPDRIAASALGRLTVNSGNQRPVFDGTVAGLVAHEREAGVDMAVVANIATNPRQMRNVNDFAISINSLDGVTAFGSVHPAAPDALSELSRLVEAGIKGIKLHPDYQDFFADDPDVYPIYAKAAELGLITLFHAGMDIGLFEPVHAAPERLANALPAFGGGVVVAAHWGGYSMWYDVEKYLVGADVYFDTSYAYGRMPPGQARRIIANHGSDRILFGSDTPWSRPSDELLFARAVAGDGAEAILGGNAARLLGLS
ncbi:MAG: amidohydrolase family protein [Clostridiales bacterium]|jgi:predicted TIM-barrel fold metal-dependent hydrolase|nr:amidohydrolase family protein [Clostridiales bacterium]